MGPLWVPAWLPVLSIFVSPNVAEPSPLSPVAWWTGKGPAVAYQKPTGDIVYSPCNFDGTVQLPHDSPYILETSEAPKAGTKLAVAGWLHEDQRIWVCTSLAL